MERDDAGAALAMAMTLEQRRAIAIADAQLKLKRPAPEKPVDDRGTFLDPFVGQGLLLGAGDEIKSGVRAGARKVFGDNPGKSLGDLYDEELTSTRADLEGYRSRHPYLEPAGEIAGAIAGAVGTRGGAGAALPRAATTLGKIGMAGAEGAGYGGVYGFNSGEGGAENRLGSALLGAAIGGPMGIATQGAAEAGRQIVRGGRYLTNAVGRMTDKPEERAVRMVNEKLQADDTTAKQAAARMQRSQADTNAPNLTLMDTADENVKGLAAAASAEPGPGRRIINRYVDQRAEGMPGRTVKAASDALGDPNAFKQTAEDLARTRSAHGKQAYDAAWSAARPVDVEPIITSLDSRIPSAKGSIQGTLQRMRGLLVRKGTVGELPERDLKSLHEAKLELDNMLSGGSETSLGNVQRREIASVRRELIKAMDAASPEYQAARKTFADESALMNALDNGRRFLKEDVQDLADQMATMGPAERSMFQLGAVREVQNVVANAPDGANVVKRVFGSPNKRDALRSVFQNDDEFRRFQNTMLREAQAARTRDTVGVRRGSRTAVLQADQQAASGVNEVLGAGADLLGAGGVITAGNVINRTAGAFSKMLQARSGMSPEVAEQVAKIMVQENPAEVMRILSAGPAARQMLPPPPAGLSGITRPAIGGAVAAGMGAQR